MEQEYLVGYGRLGDFGRFRPVRSLECRRGDRVVVRSDRGVEIGEILGPATTGHARFLPNTSVGALLHLATQDDEQHAEQLRQRGQEVFHEARQRADELGLPLEVLDAEALLDGDHMVLHFVRWADCDVRDLVSGLSKHFSIHLLLQDLSRSKSIPHGEEEEHGCGSCGEGGCGSGSCGTGGCGSCGTARPDEVRAYFAGLREQMAHKSRVPLL